MEKYKRIIIIFLLVVVFIDAAHPAFAQNLMRVSTEKNIISVTEGNKILMRYRYRDVPFKPYVQELFSPRGVNILLDAPADHLHHHALMYAVAVDGVNFWEEQQTPGRQKHVNFTEISIGKRGDISFGNLIEKLDWINPRSQELLLKESRTIRTCKPKDLDATILCWQSDFNVPSGKESVTLSGSHYFGLGMRFVRSMDTEGTLFNSKGKPGEVVRGDERLVQADWCAYTAKANGKTVTVAMFGHPDNVRHPTYWFTMTKPFAYLSATLNLHREPLKILSSKPLKLHYAVVVWDNRIEKKRVQEVYDWWINSNK
jgi:hypothetical protein